MAFSYDHFVAGLECPVCHTMSAADDSIEMYTYLRDEPQGEFLRVGSLTHGTARRSHRAGSTALGDFDSQNPNVNQATEITGVVFPEGAQSILFWRRHGLGAPCYGTGTANAALHGMPTGEGDEYCYDATDDSNGTHAYPYEHQVWAYNASDFERVKNGQLQPWEVAPYAVWNFDLPFQTGGRHLGGVAYDSATQTLYVSQTGSFLAGLSPVPVIHAFHVDVGN